MARSIEKGKIILIEGTDKSGKETQSNLLVQSLLEKGIPTQKMSFPKYDTPTGRVVGQCYLGKKGPKEGVKWKGDSAWFGDPDKLDPYIASLYFAADRLAHSNQIREIINSGTNLVLDRYVESNMAHQGGKIRDPVLRKRLITFIGGLEYKYLKIPPPSEDLTIFLYMPYQVGIKLGEKMNEKPDGHESNPEHLKHAEETYLLLAKDYSWKTIKCAPNGYPPLNVDEIHEKVFRHVMRNLKKK